MVLYRMVSFHLFNVYMDDLSVNFNKLQIGCLYAGTLINHMLCIFTPSVAGLRKLTDCCAKYGELFNITYNTNKSYCMVIESKPQDMKHIHCVNLNNHPLTIRITKCKYIDHIINKSVTDDDDIAIHKNMYSTSTILWSNVHF